MWNYILLAGVALACAACAPPALLPYRADAPPTVSLPLALAGVADRSEAFAALFNAELEQSGDADATQERWLHGAVDGYSRALVDPLRAALAAHAPSTVVLLVPGLFGDCLVAQAVPFGDGVPRTPELSPTEAYSQYADLGLRSIRMLPLPGRTSSAANGHRIALAIRETAADPAVARIVLVAYSKGVPDTLHALAELRAQDDLPAKLGALVAVAGVVMGTPLADRYETIYDVLSPHFNPFDCTPAEGGDMASLTRRDRGDWLAANPPPGELAYYSIVAHTQPAMMALPLRSSWKMLAAIDPRNDGQVIAADAILPGSVLLAQANADHWDVALPRDRDPDPAMRAMVSGRHYPREELFRAMLTWVVGSLP
jgi:hypothetical protein